MNLLMIGGTRFLGRALVDAALSAGHDVTLFNRGQSNRDLFPDLELVQGDRDGGLTALSGRQWDAVIDTCGYVPRLVADAARLLADSVAIYTFISSISVYADPVAPGSDEQAPLATMDGETETITGESYGPLKARCEKAAAEAMEGRALIIRAGLLVGPHDLSDRFTYWPVRIAGGGDVLAPVGERAVTQFIDVRDCAAWTLRATEKNLAGPYNVTGPASPISMQALLETCRDVTGSKANLHWADEEFLLANGVEPWSDMPLWIPAADDGSMRVDISKATAYGLQFRPLSETIADTVAWADGRPPDHSWRAGLTRDRERELLQRLWHSSSTTPRIL